MNPKWSLNGNLNRNQGGNLNGNLNRNLNGIKMDQNGSQMDPKWSLGAPWEDPWGTPRGLGHHFLVGTLGT